MSYQLINYFLLINIFIVGFKAENYEDYESAGDVFIDNYNIKI